MLEKAAAFAAKKHVGQVRKYTFEPYFTHVEAVARAVAADGADAATIAAAYLHDTLEDTATTEAELLAEFGPEVTNLVIELTHVYTKEAYPDLDRKARKALEAKRLATISPKAKMIKAADFEHNAASIIRHDPVFAKIFVPEMKAVFQLWNAA